MSIDQGPSNPGPFLLVEGVGHVAVLAARSRSSTEAQYPRCSPALLSLTVHGPGVALIHVEAAWVVSLTYG